MTRLPDGWAGVRLAEVVEPRGERVSPKSNADKQFIGLEHVEAHSTRILGSVPASEVKSAASVFRSGDVLYGRLRPYLNKVARPDFDGLASAEFIVFPDQEHLRSGYLKHRLNASDFVSFASRLNAGDRPRVDFEQLGDFAIGLPPPAEQKRIVEKLEELLSDLDAGASALERARANLKRYRAAVLKAAVQGRLTEKWRAAHPDVEPASRLLERILAQRRTKWEAAQLKKYADKGQSPPRGWKEQYSEPASLVASNLPALPKNWVWVRAEQVCDFITKGTTPSSSHLFSGAGDVPFIKVYNLTSRGSLDFSINPTYISHQTHSGFLARSCVFPGDVLMNIVGPPLGKVSIVPNRFPEWNINQAIAIFRPVAGLDGRYLASCLLTKSILDWAIARGKATAGQINLTLEICRDLPLPLAPSAEQAVIGQEVSKHASIVEAQEQILSTAESRAGRLRQSVLRFAFEGKLVPQDPKDEPASELLARIRAGRGMGAAKEKKRARRRAA